MSMFKSAATKIAHNTAFPSLSLNNDLKTLQELIISEKNVMQSLLKTSTDYTKSSECLRAWGSGEGEDLRDILSASSILLAHLSSALSRFSTHQDALRKEIKSVRTLEESLDDLRRAKRSLLLKSEAQERKLERMGNKENRAYMQAQEVLSDLRAQIRGKDWEILVEETKLSDYKRTSAKTWMSLKFGGLLEFAQKAIIIGETGRSLGDEIPLEVTKPGETRAVYTGQERTQSLLASAGQRLTQVNFDPVQDAMVRAAEAFKRQSGEENPEGEELDGEGYTFNGGGGGVGSGPSGGGLGLTHSGSITYRGDEHESQSPTISNGSNGSSLSLGTATSTRTKGAAPTIGTVGSGGATAGSVSTTSLGSTVYNQRPGGGHGGGGGGGGGSVNESLSRMVGTPAVGGGSGGYGYDSGGAYPQQPQQPQSAYPQQPYQAYSSQQPPASRYPGPAHPSQGPSYQNQSQTPSYHNQNQNYPQSQGQPSPTDSDIYTASIGTETALGSGFAITPGLPPTSASAVSPAQADILDGSPAHIRRFTQAYGSGGSYGQGGGGGTERVERRQTVYDAIPPPPPPPLPHKQSQHQQQERQERPYTPSTDAYYSTPVAVQQAQVNEFGVVLPSAQGSQSISSFTPTAVAPPHAARYTLTDSPVRTKTLPGPPPSTSTSGTGSGSGNGNGNLPVGARASVIGIGGGGGGGRPGVGVGMGGPKGGRFATFPVKGLPAGPGPGPGMLRNQSPGSVQHNGGQSVNAGIAHMIGGGRRQTMYASSGGHGSDGVRSLRVDEVRGDGEAEEEPVPEYSVERRPAESVLLQGGEVTRDGKLSASSSNSQSRSTEHLSSSPDSTRSSRRARQPSQQNQSGRNGNVEGGGGRADLYKARLRVSNYGALEEERLEEEEEEEERDRFEERMERDERRLILMGHQLGGQHHHVGREQDDDEDDERRYVDEGYEEREPYQPQPQRVFVDDAVSFMSRREFEEDRDEEEEEEEETALGHGHGHGQAQRRVNNVREDGGLIGQGYRDSDVSAYSEESPDVSSSSFIPSRAPPQPPATQLTSKLSLRHVDGNESFSSSPTELHPSNTVRGPGRAAMESTTVNSYGYDEDHDTPPEYSPSVGYRDEPGLGSASPLSSLQQHDVPEASPTGKKISASAFRRPQNATGRQSSYVGGRSVSDNISASSSDRNGAGGTGSQRRFASGSLPLRALKEGEYDQGEQELGDDSPSPDSRFFKQKAPAGGGANSKGPETPGSAPLSSANSYDFIAAYGGD